MHYILNSKRFKKSTKKIIIKIKAKTDKEEIRKIIALVKKTKDIFQKYKDYLHTSMDIHS